MVSAHVFIAKSLDGYIARPDGALDWLEIRDDPSEDHGYDSFFAEMDGIIMGRGTFEKVLTFIPWPYSLPVVVMSSTLKQSDLPASLQSRVRILDLSPHAAMALVEKEGWKRVYVDGGRVIQSFLREKLIRDMVVTTVPVLLGEGLELFGDHKDEIPLKLLSSVAFPSGLVQSKYVVGQ